MPNILLKKLLNGNTLRQSKSPKPLVNPRVIERENIPHQDSVIHVPIMGEHHPKRHRLGQQRQDPLRQQRIVSIHYYFVISVLPFISSLSFVLHSAKITNPSAVQQPNSTSVSNSNADKVQKDKSSVSMTVVVNAITPNPESAVPQTNASVSMKPTFVDGRCEFLFLLFCFYL